MVDWADQIAWEIVCESQENNEYIPKYIYGYTFFVWKFGTSKPLIVWTSLAHQLGVCKERTVQPISDKPTEDFSPCDTVRPEIERSSSDNSSSRS